MRRVLAILGCGLSFLACLEAGKPYLGRMDETPPYVISTSPVLIDGGIADGGASVAGNAEFEVEFSEMMEPRSLRPGIYVLTRVNPDGGLTTGTAELDLDVSIPQFETPPNENSPVDFPYRVKVKPKESMTANTRHALILRTSLIDTEGNPIEREVRLPFLTDR